LQKLKPCTKSADTVKPYQQNQTIKALVQREKSARDSAQRDRASRNTDATTQQLHGKPLVLRRKRHYHACKRAEALYGQKVEALLNVEEKLKHIEAQKSVAV